MDFSTETWGWIVIGAFVLVFLRTVIIWHWPDSGLAVWLSSDNDDGWGGGGDCGGGDGGGGGD